MPAEKLPLMALGIQAKPEGVAWYWPFVNLSRSSLIAALGRCMDRKVKYGWGAKAGNWNEQPGEFSSLDCSGFVGWILAQATNGAVRDLIGKGSWQQAEFFDQQGFKESTISAGKLVDNAVRVAFMPPKYLAGKMVRAGHIALILNGATLESCGGRGPCRRIWDGKGWQAKCTGVWVLTPPNVDTPYGGR